MSKSQLIKLSGWAFILGALSFATILIDSDAFAIPGSVISSILLAVGLLGLRAHYGERVGGFGKSSLLLGASGPFLLVIVVVLGLAGILTVSLITEGFWILLFGGPAIALLGLTLFGLAALRSKPMPRWNWLPLVAGIWYPVIYILLAVYLFTNDGVYPGEYQTAINIMFSIQCIALCVLGFVLVTDVPKEIAIA
jgi:hypothetical protein